jgi:hypothetical protein
MGSRMRNMSFATLVAGSVLVLASPAAMAQQDRGGGVGGAIDSLNRAINPDQGRTRDDQRTRRDMSGSSDRDTSNYSRYSDQDLRDEADHLADQSRQIERERRAVDDEMRSRGMRR